MTLALVAACVWGVLCGIAIKDFFVAIASAALGGGLIGLLAVAALR